MTAVSRLRIRALWNLGIAMMRSVSRVVERRRQLDRTNAGRGRTIRERGVDIDILAGRPKDRGTRTVGIREGRLWRGAAEPAGAGPYRGGWPRLCRTKPASYAALLFSRNPRKASHPLALSTNRWRDSRGFSIGSSNSRCDQRKPASSISPNVMMSPGRSPSFKYCVVANSKWAVSRSELLKTDEIR